jgi:hypothetical protein
MVALSDFDASDEEGDKNEAEDSADGDGSYCSPI